MTHDQWPWSRPLRWAEAEAGGATFAMTADEVDRARIAEGLDVESIESLGAELRAEPWLDGMEVHGVLLARVVRTCGVSLELFEEGIDEPIVLRFLPEGSPNAPPPLEGDVELDLGADDPPESIAGDSIALGAHLAEQFALALTPFPRKPGVEFQPPAPDASISPFAVLARGKSGTPSDP
jgi:hypothetical protein